MINTEHIYRLMLIHNQRKDYKNDKDDWYVRDLLCDLKHFCDEYGIDFNNELEKAERFYEGGNLDTQVEETWEIIHE